MKVLSLLLVAGLGLAGCAGDDDVGRWAGGGGGGPIYQADRRPDQVMARQHMARTLVDAARMNAAVFAGDREEAALALGAVRDGLRLAASRSFVDQHSRIIALDGQAAAVGAMLAKREPGTPRAAGELVRAIVAYHDVYAWGLVDPTVAIGQGAPLTPHAPVPQGGGGGRPEPAAAPAPGSVWPETQLRP